MSEYLRMRSEVLRDMQAEVRQVNAYNRTRGYHHGGKSL